MNMSRRDSLRILAAGAAMGAGARAAEEKSGDLIRRKIPSSEEMLPAIGLGTWQTFDVPPDQRGPLAEVLKEFAALGGKLIDSSPMYGASEDTAGDLMERLSLRKGLFVATKVWTSGKEVGIRQMEASMKKLKTPVIDLMQVHNLVDVKAHLDTLNSWKHEGIIRYLGVTHYHKGSHDAVMKVMESDSLDFLQINYSLAEREAEEKLLPMAKDRGVAVIVNRPFAGGNLFARLREKPLPDFAVEIGCTSWAQLMLKFIISHPAITCAIPATSKVKHLRDNMGACRGPLPDEAMRKRIAAAAGG
ncbi:aldo/keto reductase [Luteolibacter sp. SL250]|uniref:aldo/keto reductase n=1 Tax=Luteolibacter sp. SL250 TaxID=2995170 RepID=UPI0022709E57|nr:aldo/keto reductase [Luteolibacter sp. SL250]WAC19617.1 aldo/keto reductase [Luteolibacter sp. SL250]